MKYWRLFFFVFLVILVGCASEVSEDDFFYDDNDIQAIEFPYDDLEKDKDILLFDEFIKEVSPYCNTGEDCESGFCVDSPEGKKVCAQKCIDVPCPDGWECKQVESISGDISFICLPKFEIICKPCSNNEDCWVKGVKTGDLCVLFSPMEGSFCGIDCSDGKKCPAGYECKEVQQIGKAKQKECLPKSGICECSKDYIKNAYKTKCYIENEWGKCEGERVCLQSGLTPCNAKKPSAEICDGEDNNCNNLIDDGIVYGDCEKKNGYGTCKGKEICENGKKSCNAKEPAEEKCDGSDNDCDGKTDGEGSKGCAIYYLDEDGDSWGKKDDSKCLCGSEGDYKASVKGDCNDKDKDVNPSGIEVCDGKDNNCNGEIDEEGIGGCKDFYLDEDGDGYGVSGDKKCLCSPIGKYTATQGGDCNDKDGEVFTGATEKCNGKDDNCDKQVDPEGSQGCTPYYFDNDGDNYGVTANSKCLCKPEGKYTAQKGNDCDDNEWGKNPGAEETCNSIDDNCNGQIDEVNAKGCEIYYFDADMDTFGNSYNSQCLCKPSGLYNTKVGGDCDDNDKWAYPNAVEKCNTKDDDCDGEPDEEGAQGCKTFFYDGDGDGWGISSNTKCLCNPKDKWTSQQTEDCDDGDNKTYPNAPEICDNKDNNCNGPKDEGENNQKCTTYFYDWDGDGYGVDNNKKCLCFTDGNYKTTKGGDCDDWTNTINPGAKEVCNGKDDDCDGKKDEGLLDGYEFNDGWNSVKKIGKCPDEKNKTIYANIDSADPGDYFYAESADKCEQSTKCSSIKCKVTLSNIPSGTNYNLCACWTKIGSPHGKCDWAGEKCSTNGGNANEVVTVELPEEGCIWPFGNGEDEKGYCDIRVIPVSGYSCNEYHLKWEIWD